MKQNDISQQLGSLINKTQGIYTTVDPGDSIPSELQDPEPIFEINYNNVRSASNSEAMETMRFIVKSVVPDAYQDNEMIVNKMKLDAYQLGNLYYQQKINDITIQTAMDTLAKGDTQPRMFDVIEKNQKRASDLTDQIIELQNLFRKYYIDSYLDLKSKDDFDNADFEQPAAQRPKLQKPAQPKQIAQQSASDNEHDTQDAEHILSSSSEIIDSIQSRRLERIKAAKQAEFEEIK